MFKQKHVFYIKNHKLFDLKSIFVHNQDKFKVYNNIKLLRDSA